MLVDMSGRRQKRKGCSEAPAITKYLRVTSESSSQVQAEQNRRTPHYVRRHQPSCRWTRTCIPAYSVSRTPLSHRLATGLYRAWHARYINYMQASNGSIVYIPLHNCTALLCGRVCTEGPRIPETNWLYVYT